MFIYGWPKVNQHFPKFYLTIIAILMIYTQERLNMVGRRLPNFPKILHNYNLYTSELY